MGATSVTGVGYGAGFGRSGPAGVRASRIIYIEGDDGTMTIDNIPGMTRQDIYQAAIIITDTGRVLKDRSGVQGGVMPSFDLVKGAKQEKKPEKKSLYRSIFDPTDIQAEL